MSTHHSKLHTLIGFAGRKLAMAAAQVAIQHTLGGRNPGVGTVVTPRVLAGALSQRARELFDAAIVHRRGRVV